MCETKLYQHQQELIERNPERIGIFWGTGTGKTLTAIKLAERNLKECLVVCPKSLTENWNEEIRDKSSGTVAFNVISKERFKQHCHSLHKYKGIIIDEAHYFSGYTSQLHKSLIWFLAKHNPKYVWALTATPYLSSSWNIYSLGKLLGHDWSWFAWKRRFFQDIRMGSRLVPVQRAGIERIIAEITNRIGVTARLEDLVDVPDQIFMREFFSLTSEQKRAIEGINDLEHIVKWTKTHQIIGGTLKGDGYSADRFFKTEKLNRLLELCKENKKLVVVCRYNNEIEYISRNIKHKKVFIINGSTKDKHRIVKEADRSAEAIVLVNAACSEGYNLPSFPIMIFYSYDFSLKNYIQLLGRIQRINAVKKNIYMSLICKGTIDEDVYKNVVEMKQDFHLEIYRKN